MKKRHLILWLAVLNTISVGLSATSCFKAVTAYRIHSRFLAVQRFRLAERASMPPPMGSTQREKEIEETYQARIARIERVAIETLDVSSTPFCLLLCSAMLQVVLSACFLAISGVVILNRNRQTPSASSPNR